MKPIARKIYDPSQHTLEKKMEFMASIIFIFFKHKMQEVRCVSTKCAIPSNKHQIQSFHPASKLFHLILHSLHLSDSNKQ